MLGISSLTELCFSALPTGQGSNWVVIDDSQTPNWTDIIAQG